MKKIISFVLAGFLLLGSLPASAAYPTITLDGGIIKDGRTLLPMRTLFESLGAEVNWNGAKKLVTAKGNGITVSLVINSPKAKINNKEISLDVPAKIIDSKTMVPVRFASEALGANVNWDPVLSVVNIQTADKMIIVRVVKDAKPLTVSSAFSLIQTAERYFSSLVEADMNKDFKNTLTQYDISATKQKVNKYYTKHFIENQWGQYYVWETADPFFTKYPDSISNVTMVDDYDNLKTIAFYYETLMDGKLYCSFTLKQENGTWKIDSTYIMSVYW
ncbi:copper amine oxidase N-terminal domain-containing protein [Bacillus sp. ISL-47]|uniref:copper amine oxidase N-terminal domain-containing protein n=1 Tax=Bacillus sp. ISL-47 TaxID=2819130 RepID=UPI001BEA0F42|nr:copper amine oxidase N-terminal domain-containing protein [Bacillus sp. ISL-47]MBT2687100.1 copper amine oxidase N-terminal domain-containing protein [Bacillus sp. ISL-47]MBT2711087.1 copper amine oxidase N-terminal domain-containing protein [Pseudomonas sp. ISL-84]